MMRLRMLVIISIGALSSLAFASLAQAAPTGPSAENGTAALEHVGLNPAGCDNPGGTLSGVVNTHANVIQNRREINVSVHGALPDTTYVVDLRCHSGIGSLTTNAEGTGTAHIYLVGSSWPATYFIDISVPHGGNGAGGYGDTFIAGPFSG